VGLIHIEVFLFVWRAFFIAGFLPTAITNAAGRLPHSQLEGTNFLFSFFFGFLPLLMLLLSLQLINFFSFLFFLGLKGRIFYEQELAS